MDCAGCGRANRAGARFCGGCGRPLAPRCPACGAECEPGTNFCDACGAPLAGRAPEAAEARKVVTIVFADLIGSTALHERIDAESTRAFMERYYQAMRGAVEAQGGRVTQLLGDGVKAVFGVPRVSEDDAIRAVRAAVGMQRDFRALADAQREALGRLGLRVAVNTGEVVADAETEIIGDPVNVAARLQQEAHDGDVLLGEATQRLVSQQVTLEPFGTFALKGRAEPVAAWRVASLERPAGAPAIAFVGRDEELRRLHAIYDEAVAGPRARLAVILGSPGLGKSRLLAELAHRLGDRATLLTARCDAAGGATFAPLSRALRAWLRVDDGARSEELRAAALAQLSGDDAERGRIAGGIAALLAGAPASSEETFFVVRRFLAALAATRPLVLAIDDLHWAEPLLLDLVEHLVQWSHGVPLFVLAAARPELRDTRSSLAAPGGLVSDVVALSGLDAGAATRLAANVIGADALPAAIAGRVLAASEGNPLFLGELVRMLVEDGVLVREGDRWVAAVELADLEMPPTIHALLAARIERLRPEERTLLERAAVVGRQFSRAAVAELLAPEQRGDLDRRLEALRRSELIESDTGWLLGEPVLRFHHVLVRDAAYRRLLKGTRAELHARFADWLEGRVGDTAEHDETLGWHLEQAHQHLRELGPIDARGRAQGERAARHLAAAGRRALARDDLPLAAGLLGRALERLDADAPARADLALDWCEALLAAGDVGPAAAAVAELGRFRDASERLRAWHTCFAGQLAVLTDPQALHATAEAVAHAAEQLAAAADAAGEAKAHSVHALALARLGKIGASEAALDRALAAARRVGDRRRQNAVLAGAPLAALWGPSPVTRASGRCLDVVRVLRITQGAPAVEAVALCCQGVLEALRGRADAARRMIATSRHLVEELGITQRLLEADVFAGQIELLEGDAAAAERCLRAAFDGLRSQGLGIDAAQAAALLGRALLAQGRAAEAEALSHESEALAGDDLKAGIAWRGVRAEALARRGEHAAAVELARAAVEIAAATDALLDHADARLALAAALRAAGRSDAAAEEEARATSLWEAKGATLLAERARRAGGAERVAREPAAPARSQRRVRANAATANAARLDAAIAARDADALTTLLADDAETVHHPTGVVNDKRGSLAAYRSLFGAADVRYRHEPLASLGDSLALCRSSWSFSALASDDFAPFGAVEREEIFLAEVDARGQRRRTEFFASDHLGDAVARLYARYAELLPEGPERLRAGAIARSVATLLALPYLDRWAAAFSPAIEWIDHRTVGLGSVHGVEAVLRGIAALFQLMEVSGTRLDDVFLLRDDAIVLRWTQLGMDRAGGGSVERSLCHLWFFGTEGSLAHWEQFDADRADEALARFDALTAEPVEPRSPRRVRANAATANVARFEGVIAARDADALPGVLADRFEIVDHQTGVEYDRQGSLTSWLRMLRNEELSYRADPLATLGDSLALYRQSSSGVAGGKHDAGAYEREEIVLIEVDAQGRRCQAEIFARDRLGDAVARLYARHAELLPDGPERTRAAATARSVARWLRIDAREGVAAVVAPAVVFADHRPAGLGRVRGAEAIRRGSRAQHELASDIAFHVHDVLALCPGAFLLRSTTSGVDRASGGAYERPLLLLGVFDPEGLVTRIEWFDPDRDAEALARFDALLAEPPAARFEDAASRFENAAARAQAVFERCWRERDWEGVAACFAPGFRMDDRRALVGLPLSGANFVANLRLLAQTASSRFETELLATRGERLALFRARFSGEVGGGGGAFEDEHLSLVEQDDSGRRVAVVTFDLVDQDAAYVELDARYLAGEGAPYAALLAALEEFRRAAPAADRAALDRVLPDDFSYVNHRHFAGTGARMSRDEYVASLQVIPDLGVHSQLRLEHLRISAAAGIGAFMWRGTREGGDFDMPLLFVFGHDGSRFHCLELYDEGQHDAARARFAELSRAATPTAQLENAATRAEQRAVDAFAARDWERFAALFPPHFRSSDRRKLMRLELDRDQLLDAFRPNFEMSAERTSELLATRGDRLALLRVCLNLEGSDGSVGPSEVEFVQVLEVDERGERLAAIAFDAEDLDAAYAELDARYLAGEGAPHAALCANLEEIQRAVPAADRAALTRLLPDDFTLVSHRHFAGTGGHMGRDEYLASLRVMDDLHVLSQLRLDHLRISASAGFGVFMWRGTREGGDFDMPLLFVFRHDGRRLHSWELYDEDQLEAALARYAELSAVATASPRIENAASRGMDRMAAAWRARDWKRFAALFSADHRTVDRRKMMQSELTRDEMLEGFQSIFETASRLDEQWEVIATRGDRLALVRQRLTGEIGLSGTSEVEYLLIIGVDERGDLELGVAFDLDALDAAYAELDARFAAGEAASQRRAALTRAFTRAFAARDWEALAALLAPDLVVEDHRRLGWETLHGPDAYLEALRALVELAPDVRLRVDHVSMSDPGFLYFTTWQGTREGGAFEEPSWIVCELDASGRICRFDQYDEGQQAEARARLEALRPTDPASHPPSAPTQARRD